ncbi:TraX protein [Pseudomonas asplenii]|uniref:TraX protein n=1 Tax=Pseudomonas asplenii TaxID=53407 RepID=A0A1H1PGH7_9PSED|nr:TraX family protein [Pseudomonas asplenii]SDS09759.1 TraX protein [Pseudomonas asplenii]
MKNFERNSSIDLIKWVALFTMIIDHTWFVLPNEIQENLYWMRIIGRFAYPLFCLAIAANVVRQQVGYPGRWKYLGGIILFAMLSQWPYSRFFDNGNLNIFFTLALGLCIAQAAHHRSPRLIAGGLLAFALAIAYRPVLGYGVTGVLLPVALMFALKAQGLESKIASWSMAALLAVLANGGLQILLLSDQQLSDQTVIAVAAIAPPLGLLLLQVRVRPLRPVGSWLYPLYPIHLMILKSLSTAWT